eukprot:704041-Pelagomonas_calceolata.AAC.7
MALGGTSLLRLQRHLLTLAPAPASTPAAAAAAADGRKPSLFSCIPYLCSVAALVGASCVPGSHCL